MFSLKQRVKSQWQISLLFILFLPLLLRLGFWQLERADEKAQLLAKYQQQRNLPAQIFSDDGGKIAEYQSVIIEGAYNTKHYWLLDNKPRSGKVGYEVVMPFWTGKQWVLINRGWVIAPVLRSELPVINTPEAAIKIQGYFYQEAKNAIIKNTKSDHSALWPKRVLQLDVEQISRDLDGVVYPKLLRIQRGEESAFITEWPLINTLPEKHSAYAVQWFAMALMLSVLYGWALFKK